MRNPHFYFITALVTSIAVIAGAYYWNKTTPSAGDVYSLAGTYILGAILYFTVIPVLQQPHLKFSDELRDFTITVEHKMGSFRIRLFVVGIENSRGLTGATAEDAEMALRVKEFKGKPPFEEQTLPSLPWSHFIRTTLKLEEYLDPTSPQAVWDSLSKIIFNEKKVTVYQGEGAFAIVGFSLDTTGNFYYAYEEPENAEIDLNKLRADSRKRGRLFEPFVALCVAKNLRAPIQSRTYIFVGDSWDTIQLNYFAETKTLGQMKDGSYITEVKMGKGMKP